MMKVVLARKIIQVGNALLTELMKEAPDLIAAKFYADEIAIDIAVVQSQLKNEGVEGDEPIRY